MNFETWAKTVPAEITGDSLWILKEDIPAYRANRAPQNAALLESLLKPEELSRLLQNVPMT